jgi:hypothetical protein
MAGYLSNLAARFFSSKPAVRPRLPSLFESAPGPSMLTEPERTAMRVVEQERIAPQPVPAATVAPATRIDSAPPARPAPVVPNEQRTPEIEETRTVEPEVRRLIHRVREPLHPVDVPSEAPHPPTSPHVVVRPELRPSDVTETALTAREHPALSSLHSESKPERPLPVELPLRLNLPPQPEEPRIGASRPLAERAPVTAPPTRPLAPLIAPQPEPRPAKLAATLPEPAPQESPSVQVTIGRLIVEAVMPASAPAAMSAPRAPVPRLSLDDYLRQRRSQA